MKIDFRALDLNDYSVTGGETNWYSTTDKKGTINVSVSTATANASTTISNIPYGTKYKIYENTSGLPSFMTSSNPNSENAISNTTGVTGAHTETITNTYNTGSLKITKALAADSGATLPSGATEYTFTGTFTRNDSFDLDDYDFTATADGENLPENTSVNVTFSKDAYGNTEGHRSGTFTATITIPADATISTTGSIVISGIPTGTNFTVQESSRRDNSTVSPASDSGSISTSGSTVEKTFTNTYHDTTTLKLAKSVTTTGTVPAAVYNQSTAEYTLLVTLQQPSGKPFSAFNIASTQTLYVVENSAVTSTQLDPHDIVSGTQFAVKLAYNGTVDISNLPAGTQYKVEEASASKANTTSYSGDVTTFTDIPAETHTVNNYYQSGSLKVRKTTEGTLPSSAPSNGQYSVTVTLDAPANVSDFANYSISPPTGATLDANSTATHRIYTVNVTANNNSEDWVEFSNLPYNTAYTVQEADQTSAGNPTVTYTSSKTGSISGTNTVVIKNSYLNTHKLTLSKSFGDTTSYAAKYGVTSTTRFKYHVTLSGLGTYTVNAESVDTDGTTVITDSHTPTSGNASFDVYVTSDQSVEISGLPDNAAYSVYEDTSYGASTYLPANVSISASGDGSGSGTSSSPMEGNMGTADKAVIITNTYTDTGSLTLKKIVANRTSSDGIADAKFDVTLLIPNSVTDIGQYNVSIEGSSSPYSNGLLTLSNPDITTIAIKIINSKCHRI